MMRRVFSLVLCVMLLGGCQALQPTMQTGTQSALDNGTFMTMWSTYTHCQARTDLDEMRTDALRLNEAIHVPAASPGFVLPLPKRIERFVWKPAPRLAVDPIAMATACTLYTGQAALDAGRTEIAAEMFLSVLQRQRDGKYAYYVNQARLGLDQIRGDSQPPVPSRQQVIQVSATLASSNPATAQPLPRLRN